MLSLRLAILFFSFLGDGGGVSSKQLQDLWEHQWRLVPYLSFVALTELACLIRMMLACASWLGLLISRMPSGDTLIL
jgi:hypothetical protein